MADQNLTYLSELSGLRRFTDNAKKAIVNAHNLAYRNFNEWVEPIHVFAALLNEPTGLISRIFERLSLDMVQTKERILSEIHLHGSLGIQTQPQFSDSLKKMINNSFLIAERLSHVYVGTEHLLLAMLELTDQEFVRELGILGLDSKRVGEVVVNLGTYLPGILSGTAGSDLLGMQENASSLPFFCRDMNELAKQNAFLNITGRDKEIERLIHILSRKTKNNPILVGDAGVGKTAVVQGFVQRIVRGEVPPSFLDKQVLSLDVTSIIAGAKVRGDVEERILAVINDAIDSGNKIIFIDEIHMIVGAGAYGGRDPMDISNILKPYLVDSDLRVIGATTVAEYRKYFDDEPALARRFQPVDVEEIDKESAISILKNLKRDFEKYHGVKIKDDVVEAAVNLSSKYIADRYLPDKAIDLIDEAAASVKIGREIHIEPQLTELGSKLITAQQKKDDAILAGNLQQASKYKENETDITDQIESLIEGKQTESRKHKVVDVSLINKIVVDWTKIPLAAAEADGEQLRTLRERIGAKIVAEDHVLDTVISTLRRSHLGLTDSKRPLASFLFLGPTGVGKTELAKTIAAELFGSADLLVQLNMSEFMEMHSVAKLIGSPPGYVGYQEGGQLTEQIRRRPYSVVLFDEIEKAHPEVLNLLLQILEEGELKDGRGRKAMFHNTVVILTSNIGAAEVAKDRRLGFNVEIEDVDSKELDTAFEEMRDSLLEELREEVRPEILNRLDDIVVFRGFNEADCLQITKLMIDNLCLKILERKILLSVGPGVVEFINKEGYSKEYGARNIRRKIQEVLENGLSDYILDSKTKRPKKGLLKLKARLSKGKISFSKVD